MLVCVCVCAAAGGEAAVVRDFLRLYLIIRRRCDGRMHARLAGCDDGRDTDLYASFLSATSSSGSIPLRPSVRVLPDTDEANTWSHDRAERET